MGWGSQSGKFAIREQTAMGTTATDLEDKGVGVKIRSGSLAGNRELLVPDPEIGGGRDITDALLGPASYSGDLEFYARFQFLGTFLRGVLGESSSDVDGNDSGIYEHVITPSDESQLPFYTVYEEISSGLERAEYTDVVFNTFNLEVDPDGYLEGTAGLIGIKQLLDVPEKDIDDIYDNSTMTVGTNVTVQYDGSNIKPKSFSLDINNNYEDDDFRLGQFTLEDLTPKGREVTSTMGLRHKDNKLMRQALNGDNSAVTPGGIVTKKPLKVTIDTYTEIPDSEENTNYKLEIEIPKVVFTPFSFEPSGDDILESDVEMQALRPEPGTPIMTVKLYNDVDAIA